MPARRFTGILGQGSRLATLCCFVVLAEATPAAGDREFQLVATYHGQGGLFATAIAPGPVPQSERLYASYLYYGNTLEVTAVDPLTGDFQTYRSPVRGEYGARCMTVGPDGNLYLGTLPDAHFLKLDTSRRVLVDLGRPSATEQYVWDVTFAGDGKLYGGTSPAAKLVRYDPRNGSLEDLGRLSTSEQYAHYLAASTDGFVYAGIGVSHMDIVAYEIATGTHHTILPMKFRTAGQASVYKAADGRVFAVAGNQHFVVSGWSVTQIDPSAAAPQLRTNRMRDGRSVALDGHQLVITDPRTGAITRHRYAYAGAEVPVFRLTMGPEGRLYASSVLPARLLRLAKTDEIEDLGNLGDGEVYSFLRRGSRLLMATYAGRSPLMDFNPSLPFREDSPHPNPSKVSFPGADPSWRPLAFVEGPDAHAYIGSVPGYGKLGGSLVAWDDRTGAVKVYPAPVQNESVSALAVWNRQIVGGTSVNGGLGSQATEKDAKLFIWDPALERITFEIVPVPGVTSIDNIAVGRNGLVYGIAGNTMFVFDVSSKSISVRKGLPFPGGTLWASLAEGRDGRIWGLAGHPQAGIFAISPASNEVELVARAPKPITAGFAIRGRDMYFASGATIYRFTIADKLLNH